MTFGGVSKDVMAGFWQEAYERYGSTLLVPVVNPHTDLSSLPVLGRILSHGYLCTGFLPTQIAFPTLAAMVLGPRVDIECSVLVRSFLDYVSDVDRTVLRTAVHTAKVTSEVTFPSDLQEKLLTVLSAFGCRQVPIPANLSQILAGIARFVFLSNPMSVCIINSGIPSNHRSFWS